MNIVINYDLIKKINEAKEKPELKLVKDQAKYYFFWSTFFTTVNTMAGLDLTETICNNMLSVPLLFVLNNLDNHSQYNLNISKIRAYKKQLRATRELLLLVSRLNDYNACITLGDLYSAEEHTTKYRFMVANNHLQLLQEKYILLPASQVSCRCNGKILLQEHVMGSKEWVLSLGSPVKHSKFVPAYI